MPVEVHDQEHASLGSALLALAFLTAFAAAALALAGRNGDRRCMDLSRRAVYGFLGLLTPAS